jgi:geranylgeranylglycerol-phosphate geranylgeranyltransferase
MDSSMLASLAIFVPLFARTHAFTASFEKALPLLFVYMCAFIANDLDDIEKDQVNHPDRPLPAGYITPAVAGILYFVCLGSALVSTSYFVSEGVAFLYYTLLALHLSYGYLVESLPGLKAPYVGAMNTLPILVVAFQYPQEAKLFVAAASILFFVLGREICMDIKDRPGDAPSFMHRFRSDRLALFGFGLQLAGLFLLATQVRNRGDVVALVAMISVLTVAAYHWFKFTAARRVSIIVMKLQWLVGLYFLT